MKRFDMHNSILALQKHRQDGICPACGAPDQETVGQLFLPGQEDMVIGCERCTPDGAVLMLSRNPAAAGLLEVGRAAE